MSKSVSIIIKIVKLLLFIACLVHVTTLFISEFYPELPNSKVYQKKLASIDFPLVFQLCALKISRENEFYEMYGYSNMMNFFKGFSLYNDSLIGWNGFAENGSLLGTAEGNQSLLIHIIQPYS